MDQSGWKGFIVMDPIIKFDDSMFLVLGLDR